MTFEDFLDMMSVFSRNAPKSVKVSYAFKIYRKYSIGLAVTFSTSVSCITGGIYRGERPGKMRRRDTSWSLCCLDGQSASQDAIDLYDIREIVRRLSGKKFTEEELTSVANAVTATVMLHVWITYLNLLGDPRGRSSRRQEDHCGDIRILSFQHPGLSNVRFISHTVAYFACREFYFQIVCHSDQWWKGRSNRHWTGERWTSETNIDTETIETISTTPG